MYSRLKVIRILCVLKSRIHHSALSASCIAHSTLNSLLLLFIYSHNMSYPAVWLVPSTYTISEYYLSAVSWYTLKLGNSKSKVQSPKLVSKFPFNYVCMLSGYFLCRSNADVPTRLNAHVRWVIRKTVKLTKTALGKDTFSAIVWEAYIWSSFKHCDVFCLINSKFVSL